MQENDNDIVRGLGFVTLYAAYLEEQIDSLRHTLSAVQKVDDREHKWPISVRIDKIKEIVSTFEFEDRNELLQNLNIAKILLDRRNEVVHGRIYANFDRDDTLKSGRPNVPERTIEAKELYDLANEFMGLRNEIYRPMVFKIPRAMSLKK